MASYIERLTKIKDALAQTAENLNGKDYPSEADEDRAQAYEEAVEAIETAIEALEGLE